MNPDDRDSLLTAYALNDPSLSAADRAAVETRLASDPAAAQELEETRKLAETLTAGFATELETAPVTVPSQKAPKPQKTRSRLPLYGATAAMLLAGLFGLYAVSGGMQSKPRFEMVGFSLSSGDRSSQVIGDPRVDLHNPDGGLEPELPGAVDVGRYSGLNQSLPDANLPKGVVIDRSLNAGQPAPDPSATGKPVSVPSPMYFEVSPRLSTTSSTSNPNQGGVPDTPVGVPDPASPAPGGFRYIRPVVPGGGDQFPQMIENPFTPVEGQNALSTFGVDVDTASYAIVRKFLTAGQLPPSSAVRLEEIVNYFPYQDKPPTGDDPFAVTVEVADCPWQPGNRLARIGLKAKPIATDKRPQSNLVFLIDVSGSMNEPNKLPLVKSALKLLVGQLGESDRVGMVVYAGAAGVVLDSTNAVNKDRILAALDRLEAGGSTNGAGGLQQAYDLAVTHFIKGGTNRVILCTDGDWNVGTTSTDALVKLIEDKRKTGVFLSVFGFGMGNLRDEMMVKLAGKGNGNYGYIDTLREANKALVEQLGGTLVTVAKDVKIQVEFNPAAVKAYRLLGYEKRALAAKDFADDTKDAGEMGAGHVVTALYELVPVGGAVAAPAGDGLRYQPNAAPKASAPAGDPAKEAFLVKMRHKKPDGDVSTLRELPVSNTTKPYKEASEDFRFSAAAASFALVLRDSAHKGNATLALAQELAESALRFDPSGYRAEFVQLLTRAQTLAGKR